MFAIPEFARRALLVLTLGALAAVGCSPLFANGPQQNSYRVQLDDSRPERQQIGMLRYRGGLALKDSDPDFGGLSAIEVSPDGRRFVAISDRGSVVDGVLDYDDAGDLTAARDITVMPLLDIDGPRSRATGATPKGWRCFRTAAGPSASSAGTGSNSIRQPRRSVDAAAAELPARPVFRALKAIAGWKRSRRCPMDGCWCWRRGGRKTPATAAHGLAAPTAGPALAIEARRLIGHPMRRRCPTAMSWCWSGGPLSWAASARGSFVSRLAISSRS